MAGSSKDIIDSLIAKFHAMSDLCKAFENENGIIPPNFYTNIGISRQKL